ncbi:BsuBI/PstI family type II restriction endonuclease [Clostridium tyrobutyricum]|uniref:BsuBI/PstI family type II restriction endonuclease n=1 Tax=Clostridium tyrobutyricum TaxID=1519 RepID=UPI001C3D50B0|nr:BsuBI/PstI family type II restriction endonuclease [Clostridium tyrobutyricum]MBV4438454.1 restriction endonuclease [Clostridium tyrobutyricum]
MGKLEEAKKILKELGMPKKQYNDKSAYVLLSLVAIKEDDSWDKASINFLRIVDMMSFMAKYYDKVYKPNSRETIRKDTIHQFCDGAIALQNDDNDERATNSPKYSYRITDEALEVIKSYGKEEWKFKLNNWIKNHETLMDQYSQMRETVMIPVKVNGQDLKFSPGKHNQLQKLIIEEFAPRFAPGAEVLYVGDTTKKDLVKNRERFYKLGVYITDHDKLPDVVLYREDKNWLYFIEAVTSVGPVSVKRLNEIQEMLENCSCGVIYVTAFLDMSAKNGFKKYIDEIAWETEIWVADKPDHMIHLNGDRFIGPR